MKQLSFLIDTNLCLGCRSCQAACSTNRHLDLGVFWRKVNKVNFLANGNIVSYFISTACYQCATPECIRLCPQKAYRKRRDGIVILNTNKCTGCGICVRGCPFEAPVRSPVTGKVSKCDFCYSLVDKGKKPYCIAACPVGAIQLREFSSLDDRIDTDVVNSLPGFPKIQLTRPSVRFRPLKIGKQVLRPKTSKTTEAYS